MRCLIMSMMSMCKQICAAILPASAGAGPVMRLAEQWRLATECWLLATGLTVVPNCLLLIACSRMQSQQVRARVVAPASLPHRSNQSASGTIRCNCFCFDHARAFDDCFFVPAILLARAPALIVITCATHVDPRFCGRQRQLDCSHVV